MFCHHEILMSEMLFIYLIILVRAWVVQLLKCPTLDFCQVMTLRVVRRSSELGFLLGEELRTLSCLCPSICARARALPLSLSKKVLLVVCVFINMYILQIYNHIIYN